MKSTLNVKKKTAYFYTLGYFLVIIFSLTFAFPWAFNRYHSWLINNTRINDKKLTYTGRTKDLYKIFFIGLIIAIGVFVLVTFILGVIKGQYSDDEWKESNINKLFLKLFGILPALLLALLITTRFYKYRSINTHYADNVDQKSGIKLQIYKIVLSSIIFKLIIVLTSFFGYPFALNIRERFLQSRRYIDKDDLKFKGSIGRICGIWYLGLILSALTLTLYVPYLFFKLNRYIITNTVLKNNECLE